MSDLSAPVRQTLAGQYVIERELGRGGTATVYRARDLKHERAVALKVLHRELGAVLGAERFQREIKLLAQLQHPHILPLYDSGEAGGSLFYVMPLCNGESLRDRLAREGRVAPADALRIAREVAAALDYAHRNNVVHRDIKPENILLDGYPPRDGTAGEWRAVVADFGIARVIRRAAGEQMTEVGLALGTPTYMSPEQASGEQTIDGRTDIYSLGCMLYEMLSGERPYAGSTASALVARIFTEPLPSVRLTGGEADRALNSVIARATAKEPADRYATAAELAAALASVPASGLPEPRTAKTTRRIPRRVAAAGAGLVLAAVGALSIWQWRHGAELPRRAGTVAVLPFRVANPELALWREGLVDLLSFNLDQAGGLRAIDAGTLLSRWRRDGGQSGELTLDGELSVARKVGAAYAVLGNVTGTQRSVRLSAQLRDVQSGKAVASDFVDGPADSMPALVDLLTVALLRKSAGGHVADLPRLDVGALTTTSLPALKAYLSGEQKFRRARAAEARDDFAAAVAADSTFALAWYRLSAADGLTTSPHLLGIGGASDADRRALRFGARLPEREASLLRGHVQLKERRVAAIDTLKRLANDYPHDLDAWFLLGDAYFHVGAVALHPRGRYRDAFDYVLRLDPDFAPAYLHLIEDAFDRQDSAAARDLIERLGRIDPTSPEAAGLRLAYALVWGDASTRRLAQAAIDTTSTDALLNAKHALNFTPEFWRAALALAEAVVGDSRHPVRARLLAQSGISTAYALRGRMDEARRSNARWAAISGADYARDQARYDIYAYLLGYPDSGQARRAAAVVGARPTVEHRFLLGALAAVEGRADEARRHVASLDSVGRAAIATGDSVAGLHARAFARAVDAFGTARADRRTAAAELAAVVTGLPTPSLAHALFRFSLGRWLLDLGDIEGAERYLTSFDLYDTPVTTPVEFYLGALEEARGRPEQAAVHYARFVRWWDDCDPGLRPWREQGRQALERVSRRGSRS